MLANIIVRKVIPQLINGILVNEVIQKPAFF